MPVTEVALCNQALSRLGTRSTIASLVEASPEARQCNLHFGPVRDDMLRQAPWDFAKKFANATLLKQKSTTGGLWNSATEPPPPWMYTYAYPADCMNLRWIQGPSLYGTTQVPIFGAATHYAQDQLTSRASQFSKGSDGTATVIWTNVKDAIFCYTKLVTDVTLWDSLFCNAFECALAARVCVALVGKAGVASDLGKEAMFYISQARAVDANEGLDVYDNAVDWILARGVDSLETNRW